MNGKISKWKDDKGFGFIQPDDGSDELFFHVSSVKTNARRPQTGDRVLYDLTHDSQGRRKAKTVVIQGISKNSNGSPKKTLTRTEPPTKNAIDYISILTVTLALVAIGLEFHRTNAIEGAWPYGLIATLAFFVLNRQKKPKDQSFQCARCRMIAEHDNRTVRAWNRRLTKLYCRNCHLQWLNDQPMHQRAETQRRSGGCLGLLALMIVIPISASIGLHQWLT